MYQKKKAVVTAVKVLSERLTETIIGTLNSGSQSSMQAKLNHFLYSDFNSLIL